jgi:hypothetical protein
MERSRRWPRCPPAHCRRFDGRRWVARPGNCRCGSHPFTGPVCVLGGPIPGRWSRVHDAVPLDCALMFRLAHRRPHSVASRRFGRPLLGRTLGDRVSWIPPAKGSSRPSSPGHVGWPVAPSARNRVGRCRETIGCDWRTSTGRVCAGISQRGCGRWAAASGARPQRASLVARGLRVTLSPSVGRFQKTLFQTKTVVTRGGPPGNSTLLSPRRILPSRHSSRSPPVAL